MGVERVAAPLMCMGMIRGGTRELKKIWLLLAATQQERERHQQDDLNKTSWTIVENVPYSHAPPEREELVLVEVGVEGRLRDFAFREDVDLWTGTRTPEKRELVSKNVNVSVVQGGTPTQSPFDSRSEHPLTASWKIPPNLSVLST